MTDGQCAWKTGSVTARLTPQVTRDIAQHVRHGNYLETAAAAVGVHKNTLHTWLRRGRQAIERAWPIKDAEYAAFHRAVHEAMAESEVRTLDRLTQAGAGDWRAHAWRLERRFPDRWGRRQRVEVEGNQDKPVRYVVEAPPKLADPEAWARAGTPQDSASAPGDAA